jgi:hypothetical protein
MKSNSRSKTLLVMLLCLSLLATGCSAQWIKVALADLPVLLQMALNIGMLVTTLQSGQQLSSSEAAEIQNISNEASRDLNLLQTLYNEYEASPSPNTLQKIQNAIADINQNLPALLQAAHVSDPVLSTRITAAVNLILSTVNSFAALIPQSAAPVMAQKVARKTMAVPKASDLKKQWNQQVCGPTGKVALDSAFSPCQLK